MPRENDWQALRVAALGYASGRRLAHWTITSTGVERAARPSGTRPPAQMR